VLSHKPRIEEKEPRTQRKLGLNLEEKIRNQREGE